MWPFQRPKPRVSWGMVILILIAIVSLGISAWGMAGFPKASGYWPKKEMKSLVITLSVNDCPECTSPAAFITEIQNNGVVLGKEKTIDATSPEGKKTVVDYAVTKLPTVLVKGQDKASAETQTFLKQFGEITADGTFVLRDVVPPYKDVAANTVKGHFGVIYLTDKSCKDCYDVALHKSPLSRLGMIPSDEKTIDVADADGKQLVAKYKIESAPTLILQGELSEYVTLNQVWSQVGTIESDGTYVFRAGQEGMGPYKLLKTGEIKRPQIVQ